MKNSSIPSEGYTWSSLSAQQAFPGAPFPRKYIHTAFNNLEDTVQAYIALLCAGFDARNIHLMTGRDFVEAVEQRQTLLRFLFSSDDDLYLYEARRGQHMLSIRPSTYRQMEQIRDLLAPYRANSMTYVDTWVASRLIGPS